MPIDASRTVADLVLEQPSRARVFENLGLDYCCGGNRSLTDACAAVGVDLDATLARLEAASEEPDGEPDWQRVPLEELVDHIVSVHHDGMRQELPRLDGLLAKVVRAHGDEEERLFPLCRSGEPLDPRHVEELEDEHVSTGQALGQLRALTRDYDLGVARCNTHRATIDGLRELEVDLHRHIHEENNVLFPRALTAA